MSDLCEQWRKNPLVNPRTGREIKLGGPVYKQYEKDCTPRASKVDVKDCDQWRKRPLINPATKGAIVKDGRVYTDYRTACGDPVGSRGPSPQRGPSPARPVRVPSPARPVRVPSPARSPRSLARAPSPVRAAVEESLCEKWRRSPLVNPRTGRKITMSGKVYADLMKECKERKASPPRSLSPRSALGEVPRGRSPMRSLARVSSPMRSPPRVPSPVRRVSPVPSPVRRVSPVPSPIRRVSPVPSPVRRVPSPVRPVSRAPSPVRRVPSPVRPQVTSPQRRQDTLYPIRTGYLGDGISPMFGKKYSEIYTEVLASEENDRQGFVDKVTRHLQKNPSPETNLLMVLGDYLHKDVPPPAISKEFFLDQYKNLTQEGKRYLGLMERDYKAVKKDVNLLTAIYLALPHADMTDGENTYNFNGDINDLVSRTEKVYPTDPNIPALKTALRVYKKTNDPMVLLDVATALTLEQQVALEF